MKEWDYHPTARRELERAMTRHDDADAVLASGKHKSRSFPWAFRARFRRSAFGWKSQPAISRVREAVAEIKKVAKKDPNVAADGAVLFLERVSPALEQVDSSSGAIGSAVNHAIIELAAIIATGPAAAGLRETWLERLYDAHAADQIPYIELLAEHWAELCEPDIARLVDDASK